MEIFFSKVTSCGQLQYDFMDNFKNNMHKMNFKKIKFHVKIDKLNLIKRKIKLLNPNFSKK
jgi:hypothetical protein